MKPNRSEMSFLSKKTGKPTAIEAKLCHDHQRNGLAGDLDEGLEISGNLRRRKLFSPFGITGSFKLSFCDDAIDKKVSDAINQNGNDAHLRDNGSPAQRTNTWFTQDRKAFFEGTVGSFSGGTQFVDFAVSVGSSGYFQDKAWMLGDGRMSRKPQTVGAMRAVAVKLKISRKFGVGALLEAGKGKALSSGIKSVRTSWEMAIRNVRPSMAIIATIKERLTRKFFVSGIVINERNSALLAGIIVVIGLVIFGIKELNFRLSIFVKAQDLLLQRDELMSFFGITGNGNAGNGKFQSHQRVNGGSNDGVIAEDFFDFIGIGSFTANANASSTVIG